MDYKETLNLPKPLLRQKADLPKTEPKILAFWEELNLYRRIRESAAGRPKYILHDGPPYANGHIHMGHALNKILKDFVVKVKTMEGHDAAYVPGWDCHGLPIEHQVDRNLGPEKKDLSPLERRRLCREYAAQYVEVQKEEFKRLGILGDWERPYLTMSNDYEATIVREAGKFMGRGAVYRGLKPVHWCPSYRTALAEAEVVYQELKSPSIYVRFPIHEDLGERIAELRGVAGEKKVSVLIWTTTPWTLPANLAIAFHPEYDYLAVEAGEEVLILAEALLEEVMAKGGVKAWKILARFKGRVLEGLRARHPFEERDSLLILADYVTLDQGTGCVHTAPGHGREDYESGQEYGLETYSPVDDEGRFIPGLNFFGGMPVFRADPLIIDLLKERGELFASEEIVHDYPHDWRTLQPTIFRATAQWFISMEANGLRAKALEKIREVKWIPAWGMERIYGMVENRPDWCISRQRAWGVPIPAFHCENCGHCVATQEVAEHVASLVEEEGSDIWFTREAEALLPPGFSCPGCGGSRFRKEKDILDVWFDSGVSHAAVLEKDPELTWPCDLYLEGSDQHRGWFHSSLLVGVGTRDEAPYRTVLTHGYVVDGEGRKMSKTEGNVIAPEEIIERYGAEILRLWVASENYCDDVRISGEILERLADAYKRIRNTCRFLLGNLYDFDPKKDAVPYGELPELDRLMLHRLQRLVGRVRAAYQAHEYHIFYHTFNNFCSVDLSAFYLDVLKDRLYVSAASGHERRSAQTVLYETLLAMVKLMAPILSFTAEEIWQLLPGARELAESVHLTSFPEVREEYIDEGLAERWELILKVRGEVTKALEERRQEGELGHSLNARVVLFLPEDYLKALKPYERVMAEVFITSEAVIASGDSPPPAAYKSSLFPGLSVLVEPARGRKCERCWTVRETVGCSEEHPEICDRCAAVIG